MGIPIRDNATALAFTFVLVTFWVGIWSLVEFMIDHLVKRKYNRVMIHIGLVICSSIVILLAAHHAPGI